MAARARRRRAGTRPLADGNGNSRGTAQPGSRVGPGRIASHRHTSCWRGRSRLDGVRTRARPHTRTTGRRRDPLDAHADAGGRRPTRRCWERRCWTSACRAWMPSSNCPPAWRSPSGPAGSATGAVRGGDSPLRLERGRSAVSRRLEPVSLVPAHSGSDGIPGPPAAGTASRHATALLAARRWRKPMFWQAIKHGDSLETLCREAPDLAVLDIGAGAATAGAARRRAGS